MASQGGDDEDETSLASAPSTTSFYIPVRGWWESVWEGEVDDVAVFCGVTVEEEEEVTKQAL